ncbi:hypothetical protein BJY16_007110 [Actinoplanes octamycinicus]|uniref:Uncharacterized protein n=1 Tax=Actinoplanes octamycinicus TaxID=135948 RepID=A0A7W7H469_9ACTN|nr:hypothetical protein [Actinoplanes octamycinicus]MBB4743651.1 hypothetical protein [Actinoplanes octamycinicus]GIE61076.1 hypothetical protein Aoc01nite_64780 [Actinoplanes octamycinicus]
MSDIEDPPTLRIGGWIPPYVPREPARAALPTPEPSETRLARRGRERAAERHRLPHVGLLAYASACVLVLLAYAAAVLLVLRTDAERTPAPARSARGMDAP